MTEPFRSYIAKERHFGPFVFDFHIADETGKSWYDGSPEQYMPERQWCFDHIRPGFTILDCGAHHGMMSVLFALMTGPTGHVLAWEALPRNAAVIEKNALLNRCQNIVVHPRGLGAGRGSVPYSENAGNIVVVGQESGREGQGLIEIVALDQDIEPGVRVDFIKFDVEGSDLEVLKGAAGVLAQRPIIDLELHNFLFHDRAASLAEIFAILDRQRFSYEVLGDFYSEIVRVGPRMDIAWLSHFDNPHVFCTPL